MKTSEMIGKKFKYSYTIGKQSPGGPGFRYPVDLAIDNGDILFVVNRGSEGEPCHRISKLTANEKYIGQFGSYGNAGRGLVYSENVTNVDVSMFKRFGWGEGRWVELRAELFNFFNLANYGTPDPYVGSPSMGMVFNTIVPMRQAQLGFKIIF